MITDKVFLLSLLFSSLLLPSMTITIKSQLKTSYGLSDFEADLAAMSAKLDES